MGRLLDENDILNKLQELGWLDDTNLDDIIKEVPTAYDVNKVVEKLEGCIELKVTQYPLHGTYIKKNVAIDIVRKGHLD